MASASTKLLIGATLSLLASTPHVNGHSWLHCSDYDATINGQDFVEDSCNGYIPAWSSQWGATAFATDRGINYFGGEGSWCQTPDVDYSTSTSAANSYTDAYPMATWHKGDIITMVWPAKNHANYGCFNNIPDSSMILKYYNSVGGGQPSALSDWSDLIDWQLGCEAGTDGCGFQNCPSFCDATDAAPCFGTYTVNDADFSGGDGIYTMMWYWIFNSGSAPYTTCFEIEYDSTESTTNTGGDDDDDTTPNTGDDDDTNTAADDDTNTNVGDDDDDDDVANDDDDDDTSGGDGTTFDYIVSIPICYTGASYDEDDLIDGANSAFDDNDDVDFSVVSGTVSTGSSSFNATLQTHTNEASTVTLTAYNYAFENEEDRSALCDDIAAQFGSGECSICNPGSIQLFTSSLAVDDGSSNSGSSGGSDDSAVIIVVVLLIVVVIALGVGIGYFKLKEKKQNEAKAGGAPQFGQPATGQTNIATVN